MYGMSFIYIFQLEARRQREREKVYMKRKLQNFLTTSNVTSKKLQSHCVFTVVCKIVHKISFLVHK